MPRQSITLKNLSIDENERCQRIIPVADSINTPCPAQHSKKWKGNTIAIHLTKDEAIHLAAVLLAATQHWKEISVTARRLQRRHADGTYSIRVTSAAESPEED